MKNKIDALVTIPDTQAAFKASADDGRVQFSFPRNQLCEFFKLALMRDSVLRIRVEVHNGDDAEYGGRLK